uniref:Cadherin domain-containing protein n=1 Tax=Homalodisca liturata TaxID=320908 RepID=A0A1B6JIB9_9HEMI
MFTVVNSRVKSHTVPLRCSITSGNESGMFSIGITEDRNCELRLVGKIDHEKQYEYHLKLQLDTLAGLGNPARISTMVKIQVQDLNDNVPQFVYPETSKRFSKDKYYGAVARDRKEVGGTVLQVKASDKDSGNLGNVEYRLYLMRVGPQTTSLSTLAQAVFAQDEG